MILLKTGAGLVHSHQTIKVMKLTALFMLGFLLQISAKGISQSITISGNNISLKKVFNEIKRQSDYVVFFNSELIKEAEPVTIHVKNATIDEVLAQSFKGQPLEYYIRDKTVFVVKMQMPVKEMNQKDAETVLLPQLIEVSGKVVDKDGVGIAGVSISTRDGQNATATNDDGYFFLKNVQENSTIDVTNVGYYGLSFKVVSNTTALDTRNAKLRFKVIPLGSNQKIKEEMLVNANKVSDSINTASFIKESEIGITIVLIRNYSALSDITVPVHTGYQTLSRERSAGSFSTVSGDAVAQKANLTNNILETLEGLTPGLSVNYGTGEDKFLIRGTTSINSNKDPLIVIDGVVMEDDNLESLINSNDIASVTFLKDATAASIWGARSANGVIVITTKKGKNRERKVKISYDGSYTNKGLPDIKYRGLMNSEQFIQSAKEIFDPVNNKWTSVISVAGGAVVYPHELPMYQFDNGEISAKERDDILSELASRDNNSQLEKYLMQPQSFSKHSVSFQGGTDSYSFYGSLGYEYNQQSDLTNSNKYLINFRQDIQLAKWLKVDLITNLIAQNSKTGLMPFHTDWKSIFPYEMLADAQGNPIDQSDGVFYPDYRKQMESQSGLDLSYVPLLDMKEGFNRSKDVNGRVNMGITIGLAKGLQYQGRFQYQESYNQSEIFNDQNSSKVREELARFTVAGPNGPTYYLPTTGGIYTRNNATETSWTVRNQFSFDKTFDNNSFLTALAGMEINSDLTHVNGNTRRGYDPQSLTYQAYDERMLSADGITGAVYRSPTAIRNTLVLPVFTQGEGDLRFVSFYSNFGYTWHRKYSLNASVRADQSNLFGSDPSVQFKPIWSAGVAWDVLREDFMKDVNTFNRLNLRFSYGLSGNSPKPGMGGPYNLLLASRNTLFSGLGLGYSVMYPANDKIKWEHTRVINVGLDVAFLNNRISATIDVYNKLTTDLLSTIPVDQTLGWESYYSNFGDMRNRGVELTLTTRNVSSSNFRWTTFLTLTHNENKVLKLNIDGKITPTRKIFFDFIQGYAGNSLFAYQWAGLSSEGNPQVYNAEGKIITNYQDPDYTEKAVKFMGVTQPKWYGGLTNTFSYKDFDLSFMFVYNLGHKMRDNINDFWYGRLTRNMSNKFVDRWREPGDEAFTDVPKYVSRKVDNQTSSRYIGFYEKADINILSASYAKLRDVTLAYHLPRNFSEKLSVDDVTVRVQASNLILITSNKRGIDPEYFQYREGLLGTRYGPSWSLGLNVNFK